MQMTTPSFTPGQPIPARHAFAKPHPETRVALSDNVNPGLDWREVPDGTRSFAIICHDYDAPSVGDDANQENREVPEDLPRIDFFHWVLVDLSPDLRSVGQGEFANGVVAGGQKVSSGPHGSAHGINDFTGWFSGDPEMEGQYYGYDGPAPPWNDSIIHHYVFTLYALDVPSLGLSGPFTGHDARAAFEGHALAEASVEGTYTQNPRLIG